MKRIFSKGEQLNKDKLHNIIEDCYQKNESLGNKNSVKKHLKRTTLERKSLEKDNYRNNLKRTIWKRANLKKDSPGKGQLWKEVI